MRKKGRKTNLKWKNHIPQTVNKFGYTMFRDAIDISDSDLSYLLTISGDTGCCASRTKTREQNIFTKLTDFCARYIIGHDSDEKASQVGICTSSLLNQHAPHCTLNPFTFSGNDTDRCSYSVFLAISEGETPFVLWEGSHHTIRLDNSALWNWYRASTLPLKKCLLLNRGDVLVVRSDLVHLGAAIEYTEYVFLHSFISNSSVKSKLQNGMCVFSTLSASHTSVLYNHFLQTYYMAH